MKSPHSLLVLAIWFTICCNRNPSTYFSKSHYFSIHWWVQNTQTSPPAVLCSSPGHHWSHSTGSCFPLLPEDKNLPTHRPPARQGIYRGAPDRTGTGSVNRTSNKVINVWGLTSAWSCGTSGPVTYVKNSWWHLGLAPGELTGWHALRWIAALSGGPHLKYASRFKQNLLLASLISSTERTGLWDSSLVKADWNMPSPVKFQLYRLVSFFFLEYSNCLNKTPLLVSTITFIWHLQDHYLVVFLDRFIQSQFFNSATCASKKWQTLSFTFL